MGEYDPAIPVIPPAVAGELAELRGRIGRQDRLIRELHSVVDGLIDELNRHTGHRWRPTSGRIPWAGFLAGFMS